MGTPLSRPWRREIGGVELNGRAEPVVLEGTYYLEMENVSAATLGRGRPFLGRANVLGRARAIDPLLRSAASGEAASLEG
jgi:hypothetical protein